MLYRLRTVSALLIAVLLFSGANGLLSTLLAIQAREAGFPPGVIGMLASAYFGGFIFACVFAGRVVRQVGHIRAYAGFAAILSITVLLYPFVVHPVAWPGLRAVSGFCHAVLTLTAESWLNTVSASEERGRLFSVYRIVDLGSVTLAQLSPGLFDPLAATAFSFIAISITLALVPMTLNRIAAPTELVEADLDVRELIANSPLAVAGVFAVGFISGALWGVAPLYIADAGLSPQVVGWFISAMIVGGAILQWPLGRYSDTHDRRKMIVVVSAAAAGFASLLYVFASAGTPPLGVLIGGAFALGGSALPLYSLAVSHANDRAAPDDFVRIASGLVLFFGIGAVLGPALSAGAVRVIGPPGLFLAIATMSATLCVFGVYRVWRSDAPAAADKGRYVPMSATALELESGLATEPGRVQPVTAV